MPEDLVLKPPPSRSVSQYNQYKRCPYAYKLSRIDKVWQRPAAWLPQGSAVHEAAEAWERSGRTMTLEEAQAAYTASFDREVGKYTAITPNIEWWTRSGPYTAARDIPRRYEIGLEQTAKYLSWYTKHPEQEIWIAPAHTDPKCAIVDQSQALVVDGERQWVHAVDCECAEPTPAIELEFRVDLDGVPVRGFIDAVIREVTSSDPEEFREEITVRDNKTGNNPGDDFQLAVYKVMLETQYGVVIEQGDYWMGRSGKPTIPYDLTDWTRERVTEAFHELEANIQAERFEPDPEPSKCKFCDVSLSCKFAMG